MPKDVRRTTFLVAAIGGQGDAPVYAVMARSAGDALTVVRGLGHPEPVIVGSLASRTAKAIRLLPGEARPI